MTMARNELDNAIRTVRKALRDMQTRSSTQCWSVAEDAAKLGRELDLLVYAVRGIRDLAKATARISNVNLEDDPADGNESYEDKLSRVDFDPTGILNGRS